MSYSCLIQRLALLQVGIWLFNLSYTWGIGDDCMVGDGKCLCDAYSWTKLPGLTDVTSRCRNYYECTPGAEGTYWSCPHDHIYSEQTQQCVPANFTDCASVMYPNDEVTISSVKEWESMLDTSVADAHGFVAYYQTWSKESPDAASTRLANLPAYVTHVMLSFMKPDNSYKGGVTFKGTGLDFTISAQVVKDAILLLKKRNPGTKIFLSVGGADYTNYKKMNTDGIVQFVQNFGLDGVDLDFEPVRPGCKTNNRGKITCKSDKLHIRTVKALRDALPKEYEMSAAVWGVGAYGEGNFSNSKPKGGYSGVNLNVMREVGHEFSFISIMGYDNGNSFNPKEAFDSFAQVYTGPTYLGMEVAKESSGKHILSMSEVVDLSNYVFNHGGNGMMMWSLQKKATAGPTATEIAQKSCNIFKLQDCKRQLQDNGPSSSPTPSLSPPPQSPSSPGTSPGFPFAPPSPPPLICQYKGTYSIKTAASCPEGRYISYAKSCSDTTVRLLPHSNLPSKYYKLTHWSLPANVYETPTSRYPLEAKHRSRKCPATARYLSPSPQPRPLRLGSRERTWSFRPTGNDCSLVQLISGNSFHYISYSADDGCNKVTLTRGSGSQFRLIQRG